MNDSIIVLATSKSFSSLRILIVASVLMTAMLRWPEPHLMTTNIVFA